MSYANYRIGTSTADACTDSILDVPGEGLYSALSHFYGVHFTGTGVYIHFMMTTELALCRSGPLALLS